MRNSTAFFCTPWSLLTHMEPWSGQFEEELKGIHSDAFYLVIFDPASFYGHSEYDFGIAEMFGGMSSNFYKAYHALVPKAPDHELRNQLYRLFHHLNHW